MSGDDFNKYEFTPEEFEDYKIGYEKNWENATIIGSVSWEELKSAKEREDKEFDEAVDRIEERLVESKKPVSKPFEHKNKKSINLDIEETYFEIKDKIQNMSE